MPTDPFTPAELEAGERAVAARLNAHPGAAHPWSAIVAAVLDAVAPLIAARVRAEEREALAQHFTNLANLAASEGRRTHSKEMRHAAAIARAHRTTPGDDHA